MTSVPLILLFQSRDFYLMPLFLGARYSGGIKCSEAMVDCDPSPIMQYLSCSPVNSPIATSFVPLSSSVHDSATSLPDAQCIVAIGNNHYSVSVVNDAAGTFVAFSLFLTRPVTLPTVFRADPIFFLYHCCAYQTVLNMEQRAGNKYAGR